MADIATEARVAKPILYRHFGDRAGLARAIGVDVKLASSTELPAMQRVLLYQTGLARVGGRVP